MPKPNPYTSHGWPIPGARFNPDAVVPLMKARCGGPTFCKACIVEADRYTRQFTDPYLMPKGYDPSPILKYFTYKHLPMKLAAVSERFSQLADWIDQALPQGPEKSVALRKLLEAKDAAVRQSLDIDHTKDISK